MKNPHRLARIGAGACLVVFLVSLVYMLAIVKLRLYFESRYYPLPNFPSVTLAWPLCCLSGTMLPVLLAKGRVALPRWLRIVLAVSGGALSLVFLFALSGRFLITGDLLNMQSEGFERFLYLLSIELIRAPGLFLPPCVLLGVALAGGGEKPFVDMTQDTPGEADEPTPDTALPDPPS